MQYSRSNMYCPYAALCGGSNSAAPRQYLYSMPWIDSSFDMEDYLEAESADAGSESFTRAQRDVERVIPIAVQNSANEIAQMTALGIPPSLITYFIREMVEYIDRNYERYNKTASYNITQASEGIKTRFYWIFNILRIYGVPFEVQTDFLNNTVITALQNLQAPSSPIAMR